MSRPHWDANSSKLRENLQRTFLNIQAGARTRAPLNLATIQAWHREMMTGLIWMVCRQRQLAAFAANPD